MCTSNGSGKSSGGGQILFSGGIAGVLMIIMSFLADVSTLLVNAEDAGRTLMRFVGLIQKELTQSQRDELASIEKRIERSGKRMQQDGAAFVPKALLSEKTVHQDADQVIAWKVRSDLSDKLVRQELARRLKELNASVEARRPARGKHATYDELLAEQDRLEQYTMAVLIVTLQKLDAPQELYAEYQRRHFA